MEKKKKGAIVAASLVALSLFGRLVSNDSEPNESIEPEYNITELEFSSEKDVDLKAGEDDSGYVLVSVRDRDEFTPDDVIFVSENEEVATIEYTHDALTVYLYYDITGVSDGETYVYAKAADGDAVSEKIRVVVEGGTVTEETSAPEPETMAPISESEPEPEIMPETEPPEPSAPEQTEPAPETEPPAIPTEPEIVEPEPETVLKLVSVTSPVNRNENATLTIIGKPNTEYKISVYYSTTASTASGLENKTSDADGNVSWTWKVGGKTNAGEHRIVISGGDEKIETTFTTTEG